MYRPRCRCCSGSRRRSSSCHVCCRRSSPRHGCCSCRGRLRSLAAQSLEGVLGNEVSKRRAARRRARPRRRLCGGEAVLDQRDVHSLRRPLLHAPDSACRWPLGARSRGVADLFADPALSELFGDLRMRAFDGGVGLAAVRTVARPCPASRWVSLSWRRFLARAGSRLSISKSPITRLQREYLLIDLGLVAVAVLEDLENGVAIALPFWSVVQCVDRSRAAAVHQHSGRLSNHRVAEPLK